MNLAEALRISGVTQRQLDYWVRRGYVKAPREGTGIPRDYPPLEVDVAARMMRLIGAGFEVKAAAKLAREHPRMFAEPNGYAVMLAPGYGLVVDPVATQ